MIPVQPKNEPPDFDVKVRAKGLAWLTKNGYPTAGPVPEGGTLYPYWRNCLDDLYEAYDGVCAYVCAFIEPVTGNRTTDHFVAKSQDIGLAYEWANYRLACGKMNGRKHVFENVLDPFKLCEETFHLELVTGKIYPNPALDSLSTSKALETIERLDLDDPECRKLRTSQFDDYIRKDINGKYLKRKSPFVWREAQRQGLLYD